ncbi:MAG: phosphoribosyl-AMP cyclohydrolase [Chthonomonas sp.]|nr:phosphoribosyl-AMP cyclohydrolase [Chthonomonas sp.]
MKLDFDKLNGLVPAIVQDAASGEVLMVAFMNPEAWAATRDSGFATFWSRSRGQLWRKGETSGHRLEVLEARTDCDFDAVVLRVRAIGPGVCHEGFRSCFAKVLQGEEWVVDQTLAFDPAEVYA